LSEVQGKPAKKSSEKRVAAMVAAWWQTD